MKFENLSKHYINIDYLIDELEIKATHSSGKGGQNVNKVSTKIVLIFELKKSSVLVPELKAILELKLKKRLTKNGEIHISSSQERSQYLNKKLAINKFLSLIDKSLETVENRIATKPTKNSVEKRLSNKLKRSEKKQFRIIKQKDID